MEKIILGFFICSVAIATQIVDAQGTTFLSNLEQPSTGSDAVASDSWLAIAFGSGNNAGGYTLNSVQLGMTDASGNPNNLMVTLYQHYNGANLLTSNLGSLNGSSDPATGGVYVFSPASNLTLSANAFYLVVLTAGTAVVNGAYELSLAGASFYNPSGGWTVGDMGPLFSSLNGSSWNLISGNPQFSINATAVPEPSTLGLLTLGGLLLGWRWRKSSRFFFEQ